LKQQPELGRIKTDVWFTSHIEDADCWLTREEAEAQCVMLERYEIKTQSADGGRHTCRGFQAEQRKPEEFVVCCDVPIHTSASLKR
jgi:hypothetical protein